MSWALIEVTLVPRQELMLDESPGLQSQESSGTGYVYEERKLKRALTDPRNRTKHMDFLHFNSLPIHTCG